MASAVLEQDKELQPSGFISDSEKGDEEVLFQSIRKYLEEVTPLNVYSPLVKIRSLPISYSVANVEKLVKLIFEKVVNLPPGSMDFVRAYCELCRHLAGPSWVTATVIEDGLEYTLPFKQVLITKVIKEFEKLSSELTSEPKPQEESKISLDTDEKQQHFPLSQKDGEEKNELSQRVKGSLRFLHELFRSKMLTLGIVYKCIEPLMNTPKEEFLVPLIGLLLTILWKDSETEEVKKPASNRSVLQNEELLKEFLKKISTMAEQGSELASRGAAMLQDLIYPPPKKKSKKKIQTEESQPDVTSQNDVESQPQNDVESQPQVSEDSSKSALDPEKTVESQTKKEECENVEESKKVKKRSKKRKTLSEHDDGKEVKLSTVENPWKPTRLRKDDNCSNEDKETEETMKKVKGILNQLQEENFQTLAQKFNTLPINSISRLSNVANIIFEKAISEHLFIKVYVNLCKQFSNQEIPDIPEYSLTGMLLDLCQAQFMDNISSESVIPESIEKDQSSTDSVENEKLRNENLRKAELEKQRRFTGTMRLLGELFNSEMVGEVLIWRVVDGLLDNLRDEFVEAFCALITTGKCLEFEKNEYSKSLQPNSKTIYERILELTHSDEKLSSRSRCLLKNLIDLHQRIFQEEHS